MFKEELRAFIAQSASVPEGRVTETATFAELGIDSLSAIEIICWVEKELQIEVPETVLQRIRSMEDILGAVERIKEGAQVVGVEKANN